MNSYPNDLFITIVNTIAFLVFVYLCYFYIVALPKRHKEIINFLKERKQLLDVEIEFLEKFNRFDNIWDNFNRPLRGVKFQDDTFIMNLMLLEKDTRDRYVNKKAEIEAIDNFKMGEK